MMLGNLSVKQIEERLGIEFPEEIRQFMKDSHQSKAENIKTGRWHCFDLPFHLVCGDISTATKIYESVKEKSDQCKEVLRISINNN
jgi:hypothetical protein